MPRGKGAGFECTVNGFECRLTDGAGGKVLYANSKTPKSKRIPAAVDDRDKMLRRGLKVYILVVCTFHISHVHFPYVYRMSMHAGVCAVPVACLRASTL